MRRNITAVAFSASAPNKPVRHKMMAWRTYSQIVVVVFGLSTIVSQNSDRDLCHRYIPQNGTWTDNPPFWEDYSCAQTRLFDRNDIKSCLNGKNIYVIGNSIARQYGFSLLKLLGGPNVHRQQQKELCTKDVTNFVASKCHYSVNGTHLWPMTMEFFDGTNYSGMFSTRI